jgi:hypothetical protein
MTKIKLPPPPSLERQPKNAHKIPTKREFKTRFPSALYNGQGKLWLIKSETEFEQYLNNEDRWNPMIGEHRLWKVECPTMPVL